jgi:hypothetical protein
MLVAITGLLATLVGCDHAESTLQGWASSAKHRFVVKTLLRAGFDALSLVGRVQKIRHDFFFEVMNHDRVLGDLLAGFGSFFLHPVQDFPSQAVVFAEVSQNLVNFRPGPDQVSDIDKPSHCGG